VCVCACATKKNPPHSHVYAVLAMQEHIASKYVVGLYGNTMTTNPRALDVAADVLRAITPAVRSNIIKRGEEMQQKFGALSAKYPAILRGVTGSGLLQALHLQPSVPMFGGNHAGTRSFLAACRHAGIGVIKYVA
jgi:acetylornithine/succinyldiaminopimelate/putrescine aminotransferase